MKTISSLHVEYSLAKTHKSLHFYEFAKRIFYKGVEISPFPISALKECGKSFGFLTVLLREQKERGWSFDGISSSVILYMKVVKHLPSRFCKKLEEKCFLFEGVLDIVQGHSPADTLFNECIRRWNLPLPQLSSEICQNIFQNIVVEVFSDSVLHTFFQDKDSGKLPLWNSLLRLRRQWDKDVENPDIYKDKLSSNRLKSLFSDTPLYEAGLAILEMYEKFMEEIRLVDSTGSD